MPNIGGGIGANITSWLNRRTSSPGAGGGPFDGHATLSSGLVSYWKLGETSGNRADSVGSNTLTDTNTVLYANTGPQGVVADFNPASSEVLRNTSSDLQWGGGAFTITVWVKSDTGPDVQNLILGKDNNAGDGMEYRLVWLNNGVQQAFRFRGCGSGTNLDWTLTETPNNRWHFIAAGYDGAGNLFISIDGATKQTTAITPSGTGGAGNFEIGGWATADWDWDGKIARVGFWKGVELSAATITSLYNSGLGKSYSALTASEKTGLTAYWNLDEASGNRADSHGSYTLTDVNTVGSVDNTHPGFGKAARILGANNESLHLDGAGAAQFSYLTYDQMTLTFWFNSADYSNYWAFATIYDPDEYYQWRIYDGGGVDRIGASKYHDGVSKFNLDVNQVNSGTYHAGWNFFALRFDTDGNMSSWVNASKQGPTATNAAWSPMSGANIQFFFGHYGAGSSGGTQNTSMAHAGFWNRALEDQEISDLYAAGAGLFY